MSEALFFNYHEYSVTRYADARDSQPYEHTTSIVVTHFPNVYAPEDSVRYQTTRIVRVPKAFHDVNVALYPQFSLDMPGTEAAAEQYPGETEFTPQGYVDGQVFGYSSHSVLSKYLSQQEYVDIVTHINQYMQRAFYTFQWQNLVWCILDFLSVYTLSMIFRDPSKRTLDQLEVYVEELNKTLHDIQVVSPRASGYQTIDFQVPKPEGI